MKTTIHYETRFWQSYLQLCHRFLVHNNYDSFSANNA